MAEPDPVYRLLGPVEVRAGEGRQPLRGGKARIVLATLLLRGNRVVSLDTLSEALWDGEPPRSALPNLRSYVHQLRRSLGDAPSLLGHQGGYELRLNRQDSDHLLFAEFARQGREVLTSNPLRAVLLLRRALELWRSEQAAAGLERRGILDRELTILDGERLRVLEDMATAWFALGEPRQALDSAWRVVSSDPLRVRAWEVVLRAHHRLGEPGRLTESYQMACAAFRAELGRDPDSGLELLHDRLLSRGTA